MAKLSAPAIQQLEPQASSSSLVDVANIPDIPNLAEVFAEFCSVPQIPNVLNATNAMDVGNVSPQPLSGASSSEFTAPITPLSKRTSPAITLATPQWTAPLEPVYDPTQWELKATDEVAAGFEQYSF